MSEDGTVGGGVLREGNAVGSEAASEPWQDGLALVCEQADRIRADLGKSGGLVDRVVASARAGDDVKEPLDALHQAILATGDVLGVYGHTARHHGPVVAGIAQVPMDVVYLCPAGRCSRYVWAADTVEVPVCRITGRALRRDRLP